MILNIDPKIISFLNTKRSPFFRSNERLRSKRWSSWGFLAHDPLRALKVGVFFWSHRDWVVMVVMVINRGWQMSHDLGILDITWNSSHEKDHIPNGWVMWKMGTWLMTHDKTKGNHPKVMDVIWSNTNLMLVTLGVLWSLSINWRSHFLDKMSSERSWTAHESTPM